MERQGERVVHAISDSDRIMDASDIVQEDSELVAAHPRHHVFGTQRGFESSRGCDKKLITSRVANTIVDGLKVIEIEKQQRVQHIIVPFGMSYSFV